MKKVAFFTLKNFSGVGGIEKVGKILMKVFSDLEEEGSIQFKSFSAYDDEPDERYIKKKNFRGYKGNKIRFALKAFWLNRNADVVVLSHINLALIGLDYIFIRPKTKVILFAHGIEVWNDLSFLQKIFLHRCDQIIAVSEYTKEQLIHIHQVKENKIRVINNCLDPFLQRPASFEKNKSLQARYNLTDNDFVLFTLARLALSEKYKGYDRVLEAIAKLKNTIPSLKYLIGGKYDEKEKERIEAIIRKHHLEDKVRLTGYINEKEISGHFLLADCFIMPSIKEGFGIVFCEAMMYGLPVIAGNKDGSVDALRHGELGTMVDPDSISEISDAIIQNVQRKKEQTELVHKQIAEKALMYFGYPQYKEKIRLILN